MKMRLYGWALLGVLALGAARADLVQTFEDGEDTSNWGNSGFTSGTTTPTFLATSFGGENAGTGSSATQTFSREFKDNTDGIDVSNDVYAMSMYVQIDAFGAPSDGRFEILDGSYGSNNTANLRIRTEDLGGGSYSYHWEAKDGASWSDLDLTLTLGNPYRVQFEIDPINFSYDATVQLVDATGAVQSSKSLSGLSFDSNVITNGANGNLEFYIQASSGTTVAKVDNINIQGVPEPTTAILAWLGLAGLMAQRRRASR